MAKVTGGRLAVRALKKEGVECIFALSGGHVDPIFQACIDEKVKLIDVRHEQGLCEAHDVIVFQHPFYWYSTPAIFKEWMDLVLEHDWAYGTRGHALAGKVFFQTLTAGGSLANYRHDGLNRFTIRELTTPLRATASLCQMEWLPPFAVLGVHQGLPEIERTRHAEEYRRTLIALRDGQLDMEKARRSVLLNLDLNALFREE